MQTRQCKLPVTRPFSLKATVLSHGWHECAPLQWCEGGQCFQAIERLDKHAVRVSVNSPKKTSAKLDVTAEAERLSDKDMALIADRLNVMLGLEADLQGFYEICANHPTLHVLEHAGAGRTLRAASMTENIIKAICGTNVNWDQAVKMINRIGQLGPAFPHFRNLNAWPTPREILKAGRKYLVDICRVGYRAEAILKACEMSVEAALDPPRPPTDREIRQWHDELEACKYRPEKPFDPEWLDPLAKQDGVDSEKLVRLLQNIRGVGPTTANYLLGFMNRHDRLAIDTATVAHVAAVHTKGKKPTNKQIERLYAPYGQWKNKVWWFESWIRWTTGRQLVSG